MRYANFRSVRVLGSLLVSFVLLAHAPAIHAQPNSQTVVVHLSHYTDDLHAVSMALKLGTLLSAEGAEVTLFADLEGVRIGDRRVPQNLNWGQGKPIAELYAAFIDAGGEIVLCPHCAEAAGITEDALRTGSRLATEQETARLLLAADKILDY